MAGESMVVRLLIEQRKRLIAGILGYAERSFWDRLSPEQREDFRSKVFEAVGSFTDFTRDVLKVVDEDQLRNDRALELIEAIHASQRGLAERIGQTGA